MNTTAWNTSNNTLTREYKFPNFLAALEFVNKVGHIAEELQHHPHITMQNYNEVIITTTTHDAGNQITARDYALAEKIDLI